LGTLIFSLGNMASRKNNSFGITPVTANAWGMGIGAAILFAIVVVSHLPLTIPTDTTYLLALTYLAVFASIVGFTTYLLLVARVGSAQAGYATVIFPVVALMASTLFEGFQWTPIAIAGVILALIGNLVMFSRRR
ncbi:MAG: EamA family transporter, partial [Rhodobacteraceae bacterium]|nr:EamA family transporter [Paracoccaceae bacterium]